LEYYQKGLEINIKVSGQDHPDVAASYNNIAIIYKNQGKYEEALELYTKSLDIKTRIYGGDNHPDVAASYTNIGVVYCRQGQYERVLEYYQKALEINIKVSGQDHPDVAKSFNNIGLVYEKKGDLENALVQFQKALEIRVSSSLLLHNLKPCDERHSRKGIEFRFIFKRRTHIPAPSSSAPPPLLDTGLRAL